MPAELLLEGAQDESILLQHLRSPEPELDRFPKYYPIAQTVFPKRLSVIHLSPVPGTFIGYHIGLSGGGYRQLITHRGGY